MVGFMKTLKLILSVILIFTLMSAGAPVFNPEDANRNDRVDLADAVLWVKNFAQTAEDPSEFAESVKKVVSTMSVVAGLKTVIKDNTEISAKSLFSDFCPISLLKVFIPSDKGARVGEWLVAYQSVSFIPAFHYG